MPTALELGPEGWKPFLEAVRKRPSSRGGAAQEASRAALISRAREAAKVLKTRYGADRVVLFGSLAHGAWFHQDSDVDLAVQGLRPETYWEAWRKTEDYFPGKRVDLIEVETTSESLRKAIERDGVDL